MNTAITFDTLASAKRLREKGLSQEQAEGIATELRAASEVDVSHLATREELTTFKSELKGDIATLRSEFKADIATLRAEMKSDNIKLIMWIVGMGFTQLTAILSLLKLH